MLKGSSDRKFEPRVWYHVHNSGVQGRPIFKDEEDYRRFLDAATYYLHQQTLPFAQFERLALPSRKAYLRSNRRDLRARVLAFALLPDHFHFLVKPEGPMGLSRLLADLQNAYTRFFNAKYQRAGRLFQGTFKAKPVPKAKVLALSRYLHRHSGLSSGSQFSSYQEWVGSSPRTLTDSKELRAVLKEAGGSERYREYVEEGKEDPAEIEALRLEPTRS